MGCAVAKGGLTHCASLFLDLKSESGLAEKVACEIRRARPPNLYLGHKL